MRNRIALGIVAALAFIGATPSAPAQAAGTVHGCPVDSVCLYQAKNYAQERWQSSLTNVYYHTANGVTSCLDLPPAKWTNGTPVWDNSGSIVINNNVATSPWIHYDVYWFNNAYCNGDGGYDLAPGGTVSMYFDLSLNYLYGNTSITEYHTIRSIGLIPNGR